MKALSIKQPWASLIASGQKTIELRTWHVDYRGDLIICASSTPRRGTPYELGPLGVALCVVTLDDIVPASDLDAVAACESSIKPGEYAWHLSNVRPFEPFAIKGRLNIWEPPAELVVHIEQSLSVPRLALRIPNVDDHD